MPFEGDHTLLLSLMTRDCPARLTIIDHVMPGLISADPGKKWCCRLTAASSAFTSSSLLTCSHPRPLPSQLSTLPASSTFSSMTSTTLPLTSSSCLTNSSFSLCSAALFFSAASARFVVLSRLDFEVPSSDRVVSRVVVRVECEEVDASEEALSESWAD